MLIFHPFELMLCLIGAATAGLLLGLFYARWLLRSVQLSHRHQHLHTLPKQLVEVRHIHDDRPLPGDEWKEG